MPSTLPWIDGSKLIEASKRDFTWVFSFTGSILVTTEASWRLLTRDGVVVSSQDDAQLFGRAKPVDAARDALAIVAESPVCECRIAERSSDLIISFASGVTLECLTLSTGFESWSAWYGDEGIVCAGGGSTSFISRETRG